MNFILKMAGRTVCAGRCIKYRIDMAVDTGNGGVGTAQNEVRVIVVIEQGCGPLIVGMTAAAIRTMMPVVLVVLEMAADTLRFEFIAERVFSVTIVAG